MVTFVLIQKPASTIVNQSLLKGSIMSVMYVSEKNLSPDKIFHVIVAPCYDKKLEALQEDVLTASRGSRGTDCVLTSGEGAASGKAAGRQASACPE